jgi:hypothetical protein
MTARQMSARSVRSPSSLPLCPLGQGEESVDQGSLLTVRGQKLLPGGLHRSEVDGSPSAKSRRAFAELSELLVGVLEREPFLQVRRGDPAGGRRDLSNGLEHPPRDKPAQEDGHESGPPFADGSAPRGVRAPSVGYTVMSTPRSRPIRLGAECGFTCEALTPGRISPVGPRGRIGGRRHSSMRSS